MLKLNGGIIMNKELLDSQICVDLRDAVNETDIFVEDPIERPKFNIICAIMDRMDTCTMFINTHKNKPKTEADLLAFVNHGCILIDGVKSILEVLDVAYNDTDKNYFKDVCMREPYNLPEADCPTDDKFFEYFRSLAFAHPFATSRNQHNWAKQQGETHYSPYLLVNSYVKDIKEPIGAMVYSSIPSDDYGKALVFSFDSLKEYIKSKYLLLQSATDKILEIIKKKEDIWKQRKVNRTLSNFGILKDAADILKERYQDHSYIDIIISYLECETICEENEKIVKEYKDIIVSIIPEVCDAIDVMDYETYANVIDNVTHIRPKKVHGQLHYQLEKIYCNLNDYGNDLEWGLKQAEAFSKEFARKWVKMLPRQMSFVEIKMLTTIACYYEAKEQQDL